MEDLQRAYSCLNLLVCVDYNNMSKLAFLTSQISGSQRKAAICVGCQSTRGEEAQSVTEQWILGEVPGRS